MTPVRRNSSRRARRLSSVSLRGLWIRSAAARPSAASPTGSALGLELAAEGLGFRAGVCFQSVMRDVGKFDAGALHFTLDDIIGSEP